MTVEAVWIENAGAVVNARDERRLLAAAFPSAGRALAGSCAVTQRGAGANMSVDVAAGCLIVAGTESATQGSYGVYNNAVLNRAIVAAHATLPRIDIVIAQVVDSEYSGLQDAASIYVVAGTPASTPAAPAAPANSLILSQVAVAAADGSIVNANLTAAAGSIFRSFGERKSIFGSQNEVGTLETWTTWGLEVVTFNQPPPGLAVTVWGQMCTTVYDTAANAQCQGRLRVRISLDGGATFTTGPYVLGETCAVSTVKASRESMTAQHLVTGTPTGQIVVAAECAQFYGAAGDLKFLYPALVGDWRPV